MISIRSAFTGLVAGAALSLVNCAASAGTLTVVHAFHNKGQFPHAGVVKAGQHLVGTAFLGGTANNGTVYRIPLAGGTEKTLHTFTNVPDGGSPQAPLLKVSGELYGTTISGGDHGFGTVFRIGNNGADYTVLHSFDATEGRNPVFGVIHAGGYLYGTLSAGGPDNKGAVFKMDLAGNTTVLHSFNGSSSQNGPVSRLVKINNRLYGTTYSLGAANKGTIYSIKTDGTGFQVLHEFAGGTTDGANPFIGQLVTFAGSLWGITPYEGQHGQGTVFRIDPDGTDYSVVYSFQGAPDAGYPIAPLLAVQPGAGAPAVLYGTTATGGDFNCGTIFKITATGLLTVVYSFTCGLDGGVPQTELVNIPDALGSPQIYGATAANGEWDKGTVFKFTP